MDINLAVISGRLATTPEVRTYDSGSRMIRFLVTVAAKRPRRRIDVIPVVLWDPDDALVEHLPGPEAEIWITGVVQRRAEDGPEGRRNNIEVVADQVVPITAGRRVVGVG